MQPLIDELDNIFGKFSSAGCKLIDEEVADAEAVGTENDDNEGKIFPLALSSFFLFLQMKRKKRKNARKKTTSRRKKPKRPKKLLAKK